MDERWRTLLRVRDIRTRLALNEVSRQRRAHDRAQNALEQARCQRNEFEGLAFRASDLLTAPSTSSQQVGSFQAADAQVLLDFAASARSKAREATALMRRAQLQSDRALQAVNAALAVYRREAGRKQAVESHWQAELRAARLRQLDREDTLSTEEFRDCSIARRGGAADPDDRSQDGGRS
jgi:hypothetical protein